MKRVLSLLVAVCMIVSTVITPGFAYAKSGISPSEKGIVLEEMTRAEWMHNLAVVFDMNVESELYPDNYFSDLDSSSEYYYDVLLNVQFGVVDVETDGEVKPDVLLTRDFAVSTLNYCLGYQLDEESSYTFSEMAETLTDADSAQIALNRGWVQLIDGAFSPEALLTVEEGQRMLEDAQRVLAETIVDEGAEDSYAFAEDVIEIPKGTTVELIDEDTLTITDCTTELEAKDKFAVWISSVPNVYEAVSVYTADGVTTVDFTAVEHEEAFTELEMQGVIDSSQVQFIPEEGVDVEVIETIDWSETMKRRAVVKMATFKTTKSLSLANVSGTVGFELANPSLNYHLSLTDTSYIYFRGDADLVFSASVKSDSPIHIFTLGIPGVGGVSFDVDLSAEGSVKGTTGIAMTMGVSASAKEGIRLIKDFSCKTFSITLEATGSVGMMVQLGITDMPVFKGTVFASAGQRARISRTTYDDELTPKACSHTSAYFYTEMGTRLDIHLGLLKYSDEKSVEIFNENNSPKRLVCHFEDGKPVASCTREAGDGYTGTKYFTSIESAHSGGDAWQNLTYGLGRTGIPICLYDYRLDADNQAIITAFHGLAAYLSIPEEIDGYPVVGIDSYVFEDNSFLLRVELPDTLKHIEAKAFYHSGVKEVIFPDGMETIEAEAFGECDNLRRVYVPASVEITGYGSYGPFNGCDNLKTIELEEGITHIAANLFNGCTGLDTYDIPDTVTTIKWGAFQNCSNLYHINIPESVTTIESYAFERCKALTSIDIPSKVNIIPERMCCECTNLGEINIPETATEIGDEAFRGTAVTRINLPDAITYLGEFAFGECQGLTSVHIPKSLTAAHTQSWGPFYHCENLKTVTFDQGVTKIADVLLSDCSGLESVTVPETVTEIGTAAFQNCNNLTEVVLPEGLTVIGHSAFMNCSALKNINLPSTLTTIDPYGFYYCTALEELILPDGFTTFTRNYNGVSRAFEGCSGLQNVTIPSSVKTISGYTFYRCVALEEVIIEDGITSLDGFAFGDDVALKKAVIPASVTSIDDSSFSNCENLTIYGFYDSYAESFAASKSIPFVGETVEPEDPDPIAQNKLTINSVGVKTYGDAAFRLTTSGGSGSGNVTWSVPENNGVVKLSGNQVTILGAGTVTITAKKAGDSTYLPAEATYKLTVKPSTAATLKISATKFIYDGTAKGPKTITVTGIDDEVLKKGTDYTIVQSKRTSVGTGKVEIELKGNYTGTLTKTFYVVPKATSKVSANLYKEYDRVKVSWNKVSGASGYLVQYKVSGGTYQKLTTTTSSYTTKAKELKDGKKYYFRVIPYYKDSSGTLRYSTNAAKSASVYTLKKVSQKTIKKYSSTKVTVRWYDISGQSGYQISRSTSASKKSVYATVASTSATSKTIKTTKGKTYYYRVRAYKKVGDDYIYGPWSDYQKKKI